MALSPKPRATEHPQKKPTKTLWGVQVHDTLLHHTKPPHPTPHHPTPHGTTAHHTTPHHIHSWPPFAPGDVQALAKLNVPGKEHATFGSPVLCYGAMCRCSGMKCIGVEWRGVQSCGVVVRRPPGVA
uniref:Uncharacterized protein n=1 Tax=Eutreptiella gymnastica TaxID=73025 RepID=A0A7S4FPV7_9EUGL